MKSFGEIAASSVVCDHRESQLSTCCDVVLAAVGVHVIGPDGATSTGALGALSD